MNQMDAAAAAEKEDKCENSSERGAERVRTSIHRLPRTCCCPLLAAPLKETLESLMSSIKDRYVLYYQSEDIWSGPHKFKGPFEV